MGTVYVLIGANTYDETKVLGLCSSKAKAELAKEGIIHYGINDNVYDDFTAEINIVAFEMDGIINGIKSGLELEKHRYERINSFYDELMKEL